MESSRIFVKNLPNTASVESLRKHFSREHDPTTLKFLPDRGIAFVGYKDHETAIKAANFYNRTYVGQCKLSVTVARPLGPVRPPSQKTNPPANANPETTNQNSDVSRKRKRDAGGHAQKNTGIQEPEPPAKKLAVPPAVAVSDDDWLRSRTNRLLDLVDPGELEAEQSNPTKRAEGASEISAPNDEAESHDTESQGQDEEPRGPAVERIKQTARLYVRNLAFSTTEADLWELFGQFGGLEEVHVAVTRSGQAKGYAFAHFTNPAHAIEAYQKTDAIDFHGRILHVLPGDAKRVDPMAQKKAQKVQGKSGSTFRWNDLFMSQDAINATVAKRRGIAKSDLVNPTSSEAAVTQAIAETEVIMDAKAYFTSKGIDLNAFKSSDRRDTSAILVKNFPHGTTVKEFREMYEPYGDVRRVLIPPTGTIAVVEFAHHSQAKVAYFNTAYRKFKGTLLYLEKAPKNLFKEPPKEQLPDNGDTQAAIVVQPLSAADLLAPEPQEEDETGFTSLFVKNLNFNTTSKSLTTAFEALGGFMGAFVKTKVDPKKPGNTLSAGFGFVQFRSKEQAQRAMTEMDGYALDGHQLSVKMARRGIDVDGERRTSQADQLGENRTKLIIRNLPFQTSKKELRRLIEPYGRLKALRLPERIDGRIRGFAFATFTTPTEANHAFNTLRNTHLLGRRLVIDWAEVDSADPEEELAKMRQKVGSKVEKGGFLHMRMQGGRRRFDVEENDETGDA